ncbi:hypothetical protein SIN8267_03503 [Sinobacterium norvegicum]|uniref:Uncharacterized protein n=1 Tax=Sinobacterium norvegicum TaxID=1641715 RepID=A0ABM9AJE5_9GAMM|nr:hypothetical protein [Sinobacterium norvegicum]CAH0993355.1 hypothetical protein SIN8267_03503 [Sinobacterium norvegicum]
MDIDQGRAAYADVRYTDGEEVTDSLIAATLSLLEKFDEGIFVVLELPEDREFHYLRVNPIWWLAQPTVGEGWKLMAKESFDGLVKQHLAAKGIAFNGIL